MVGRAAGSVWSIFWMREAATGLMCWGRGRESRQTRAGVQTATCRTVSTMPPSATENNAELPMVGFTQL